MAGREELTRTVLITTEVILLLLGCALTGRTTEPWPAEAWTSAETLTHLDDGFTNNMSGAVWNPQTRAFWVCSNGRPSACWSLVEDGANSFMIATDDSGTPATFDLGRGDLEGICQADYSEEVVYILVEGDDLIREYDVSNYGAAALNVEWDISEHVPTDGRDGSEGITFVPNEWLIKQNFVDGRGIPYAGTNGMDGLMFVAHQNGGSVYVFDLNRTNSTFHFVGAYKTSQTESAGLEFDRSTGLLYVLHNLRQPNNYLEVAGLSSTEDGGERRLTSLAEFFGPNKSNLEGLAIVPTETTNNWCLMTDDSNKDGGGIMWFKEFEHPSDFDAD